eukprot:2429955-Rhodomonas_salina.4
MFCAVPVAMIASLAMPSTCHVPPDSSGHTEVHTSVPESLHRVCSPYQPFRSVAQDTALGTACQNSTGQFVPHAYSVRAVQYDMHRTTGGE